MKSRTPHETIYLLSDEIGILLLPAVDSKIKTKIESLFHVVLR